MISSSEDGAVGVAGGVGGREWETAGFSGAGACKGAAVGARLGDADDGGSDDGGGDDGAVASHADGVRLQSFGLRLFTTEQCRALSVVRVTNASTFTRNVPTPGGVNDILMGSTDRQLRCGTCKAHCDGHFGHIELAEPVLRMGYVNAAIAHLRTVCRVCARPKWQSRGEGDAAMAAAGVAWVGKRSPFVNAAPIFARTPEVGHERIRALAEACRNRLVCPWSFAVTEADGSVTPPCGAPQPTYRRPKENKLTVVHAYGDKQLAAMASAEERAWALQRLTAAEIRSIMSATPMLALAQMGYRLDPASLARGGTPRLLSHPRDFCMEVQLVPPPSIRPSIHLADGSRCRGEDDMTINLQNIVKQNNDLARAKAAFAAAAADAARDHARRLERAAAAVAAAEASVTTLVAAAAGSGTAAAGATAGAKKAAAAKKAKDTPHIDAELAVAALAAAEEALHAARRAHAAAILEADAACAKERDAYHVAWDKLTVECAALITPSVKATVQIAGVRDHRQNRASRRKQQGLKERLAGKKGRMRGNLAGRRTDQSARCVIGPDASHNIWELGVPAFVMRTLTFPERVTEHTARELAARVARGAGVDDGAVTVLRPDTTGAVTTVALEMLDAAGRAELAASLQVGWTVERMLRNGDWVLFNRQPSLHKASMQAFQIYRVPGLQFKLPIPLTRAYNADFDGDEMNLHCLQSMAAVAEAANIMAVPHQMLTPSNGVIIALVQDAVILAYKMTAKDVFLTRAAAMQLVMCMQFAAKGDGAAYGEPPPPPYARGGGVEPCGVVDWLSSPAAHAARTPCVDAFLPTPAILKGTTWDAHGVPTRHGPRWTGKQIMSWLLPPRMALQRVVGDAAPPRDAWAPRGGVTPHLYATNSDARERTRAWFDDDDVVLVADGELLCGRLCKATVGCVDRGIVHVLWRQYGPWAAAKWVSDAQRVLLQWGLTNSVCISITDTLVPRAVEARIDALVATAMGKTDALLAAAVPEYVREVRTTKLLQDVMREVGAMVLKSMAPDNGLYQVCRSGAKGTPMNLAQICGLVGPQSVFGARIEMRAGPRGPRTLMGYAPGDGRAEARGFVANSFVRGLTPSEFFAALMAGREGIINTSIYTAETGYNQRRMVKGEESAAVMYDGSVRVSNNQVIMLHYGGDDYDGAAIEKVAVPALRWSDAELAARCGTATLAGLTRSGDAHADATHQDATHQDATHAALEAAAQAYLDAEAVWLPHARNVLRRQRLTKYGASPRAALAIEFALPVNLDALVGAAHAAGGARLPGLPRTRVAAARWVLRLAAVVADLLAFMIDAHAMLAGKPRPPLPRHASVAARAAAALHHTEAYGDPSLTARCVAVLQLSSGNALRRHRLAPRALAWLGAKAVDMYRRALIAPGEGVGAVGASSIGEPSTQMTLSSFHSSGASNIANEGLPRFKQLIDAKDTQKTATMTIRFTQPMASSEARVRAFVCGMARVTLAEVVAASDIFARPLATLDAALATLTRDGGSGGSGGGSGKFTGLAHLLAVEAVSAAAALPGVGGSGGGGGGGGGGGSGSDLDSLGDAAVVRKAKKAMGKAADTAVHALGTVSKETLKKRRAACALSGAHPLEAASRYVAAFRFNAAALLDRALTAAHVEAALRRVLDTEAAVVSTADLLLLRPLDVPSRVGLTAAAWTALADAERAAIEKAVTEALHDALVESLVVHGHPAITRAHVRREVCEVVEADGALASRVEWVVDTEGSDLLAMALLPGVDAQRTVTNNVMEVNRVLGVEAGVAVLQAQLHAVICDKGPYVDPRHMALMAVVMGRSGDIVSLNRHNMKRMGGSTLARASYEQTKEVFEEAALFAEEDPLAGATEAIIVGQPFRIGTGAFDVLAMGAATMPKVEAYVAPLHATAPSRGATDTAAALGAQAAAAARKRVDKHGAAAAGGGRGGGGASGAGVPALRLLTAAVDVTSIAARTYVQPLPDTAPTPPPRKRLRRTAKEDDDEDADEDAHFVLAPFVDDKATRARGGYVPSDPAADDAVPRALAAAVEPVAALAAAVRDGARHATALELEARLGRLCDGAFVTGVSARAFGAIEAALESYKGWADAPPLVVADGGAHGEWEQATHDVYDLEDGTEVRTIVDYALAATRGVLTKTHLSKVQLAHVDMAAADAAAVRVSVAAEDAVAPSRLQGAVKPKWVGIKQRKAFRKGAWTFTLTRVWGGATHMEAEAAQFASLRALDPFYRVPHAAEVPADATVYDVEVELTAPYDVLEQRGNTDASIAHALLARVTDLLVACGKGGAPLTPFELEGIAAAEDEPATGGDGSKEGEEEDEGCVAPL